MGRKDFQTSERPFLLALYAGQSRALLPLLPKPLLSRAASMGHLQSQGPMELMCIDFLCLESDFSGQGNVLVLTDNFANFINSSLGLGKKALWALWTASENLFRSIKRL